MKTNFFTFLFWGRDIIIFTYLASTATVTLFKTAQTVANAVDLLLLLYLIHLIHVSDRALDTETMTETL